MFKSLFSKKDNAPRRDANDPTKLEIGDVIELSDSYGLPEDLRSARFTVKKISSYEFSDGIETEFQLAGASLFTLFLTVEDDDGDVCLNFSRKVDRKKISELFDVDDFSEIFDGSGHLRLKTKNSAGFEGWVAEEYSQTAKEVQAFYYEGWDLRPKPKNNDYEEDEDELRYYEMEGDEGKHYIEIEVWDGGETDISLTLSLPMHQLEGIYPVEKKEDTGGW